MRAPLYRDFLTPSLHRRFTGAAVVILIVSYVEAVLIGDKSSCEYNFQSFLCNILLINCSILVLVSFGSCGHSNASTLHLSAFNICITGCTDSHWYSQYFDLLGSGIDFWRRDSDNSFAVQDCYQILLSTRYRAYVSMVPVFSMVVQRSLHVVCT